MNKSQYLYNLTSQFESNKDILDSKRHYTAETLDDKYIHFKNKRVILPIKDISESTAADICVVENNTLNKYIVDGNNYSTDLFPLEQYTPIGVVVVPASHTDDGTARVISLVSMDYNNPDNGNTDGHVGMLWGGYNSDISTLPNLTRQPYISTDYRNISGEQQLLGWTGTGHYLVSDYFNTYPNPYDEGTYYRTGTTSSGGHAIPSPYLTGGGKNEIYHNTSNTGNILADMDGKGNTEKILAVDNGRSTDWQTAVTITNTGDNSRIHPSAQCCWRYHTVGTQQGDWYLPSAGELGYLASRWKAINNSIDKLVSSGFVALVLPVSYRCWSSTEYSRSDAVLLLFLSNYAYLDYNDKDITYYVRSFLAV